VTPAPSATTAPTPAPTATAGPRAIGSLSASDEKQTVIVEANVIEGTTFSKGVRFILDDGTGKITLLLWSDIYAGIKNNANLRTGSRVRVVGAINVYQNALELQPKKSSDVTILGVGEGVTRTPVSIASLSASDVGKTVLVKGKVKSIAPFSKGQRVVLDDGTGTLNVTIWDNVWSGIANRERIVAGVTLSISGKISEYKGALELQPALPSDVAVE
jgi:DNA/RNA endonuclease YhcR with UshA esterase domain